MDDTPRTRSPRRLLVAGLVVASPIALAAAGLVRERVAHAGGAEAPAAVTGEAAHPKAPGSDTVLTEAQENALQVRTVEARRQVGDHPIVTGGKVSLDIEHTARVRPLLNSTIFEVKKRAGDEVQKGDELLVVESTDLGDAKNGYLTALANLEVSAETYRREALLRAKSATTESDYHTARAGFRTAVIAAEAAREKCLLLGVHAREIEQLETELPIGAGLPSPRPTDQAADGKTDDEAAIKITAPDDKERASDAVRALGEIRNRRAHSRPGDDDGRRRARYTIRAPIGGTLIAKDAARGELVDPSQVIATVSDLAQLWINVDVYQKDIPRVKKGARVDVFTATYPDTAFVGSVTFLSESVDDATHTLKARVVVDNAKRQLKSGMAAKCVIHCLDEEPRIELPPAAIVHEGEETYVIVRVGPGHYRREKVKLGFEAEDAVHVEEGLAEGAPVVLEGNLFIHTSIPLGD